MTIYYNPYNSDDFGNRPTKDRYKRVTGKYAADILDQLPSYLNGAVTQYLNMRAEEQCWQRSKKKTKKKTKTLDKPNSTKV